MASLTSLLQIDPFQDPRILKVDESKDDLSVQDLHDTVKDITEEPAYGTHPTFISTAGGEDLGAGVSVGLSTTLKNMQVAFLADRTPLQAGTVTKGDTGGVVLTDTAATFETNSVVPGCWVVNWTDKSLGTVLRVLGETSLRLVRRLGGGGSDLQFDLGDEYTIYPVTKKELSGGNAVAVDAVGATINAVLPTALTQVVATRASSATQASNEEIADAVWLAEAKDYVANGTMGHRQMLAAYLGPAGAAVHVDPFFGTDGSVLGTNGTVDDPVETAPSAKVLADALNIRVYYLMNGTTTLGESHWDWLFIGQNTADGCWVQLNGQETLGSTFRGCGIIGTMGQASDSEGFDIRAEDCFVGSASELTGSLHRCTIHGTLTVGANIQVQGTGVNVGALKLIDCHAWADWGDFGGSPISRLDMNDDATDYKLIEVFGYEGKLQLEGMVNAGSHMTVHMRSGHVYVDSTCTAGDVVIFGNCLVTDASGAGCNVNTDGVLAPSKLTQLHNAKALDPDDPFTYPTAAVPIGESNLLEQNAVEGGDGRVTVTTTLK